jgi:outer membrane protein assembly factor BamE (lipoprotein component of BamABCDE complex)
MKAILAGYALLLLLILSGCSAVTSIRQYNLNMTD